MKNKLLSNRINKLYPGLSLNRIAVALDVSPPTLSKALHNFGALNISTARRICGALNVTIDETLEAEKENV